MRLAQEKIDVTQDHIDAIKKTITLLGTPRDLADFLGVNRTNVYLWINGYQPIPLKHAEHLAEQFPEHLDVLMLRPDLNQYSKYFK